MKFLALLLAAAALAGCSSLKQQSHGSWLDRVGRPRPAAHAPAAGQAQAVREQQASLQARADALRVKLAAEPDRVQRIAYFRQLMNLGDELRGLEEAARAGRTERRRLPTPAEYPQAGGR